MDQSQIIISATNIEKSFGSVHALQGVSLNVEKGKVLGLLGPNGAGKTTLVRILTTLLDLDKGSATISGIDLVENPAEIRTRIGLAGQYAAVDENLTGQENLELMGRLYHLPKSEVKDRAKKLLARFSLLDSASRPVKTYSGGMRRRLDLAASLVGEPEILFLDEPTTGLDPHGRAELWEVIEDLVKDGTTVLLTTQYLEEADYLADTIVMIDHGKVIVQGTSAELKATIGGGVLELSLVDRSKLPQAMSLIKNLGVGEPEVDQISGHITISVEQGSKNLIEAIRILDGAGLEIADIELRKPSLDEVFIKLTGKGASEYDQR